VRRTLYGGGSFPRDLFLGFVPLPAWVFVPWFLCPLHTSVAWRLRKTRDDTAEGGCFLSILWCRWLLFALSFVVVVVVAGVYSLASAACDRPSSTLPRKQKLKTVWVKTNPAEVSGAPNRPNKERTSFGLRLRGRGPRASSRRCKRRSDEAENQPFCAVTPG